MPLLSDIAFAGPGEQLPSGIDQTITLYEMRSNLDGKGNRF
jgi:hypothetical protein